MLSVVDANTAAGGPTGVANQIHQTVSAFHSTKVRAAHPNIPHHSRREEPYEPLIHNRGINATGSVSPVIESQPEASKSADKIEAASLSNMDGLIYPCKCT